MILISGIIGVTIFATNGQFLGTAGPAGFMTAIVYVGLNAIFVMECLSELTVLWPVSNAMVNYVKTFVDEELALVAGLAYWLVLRKLSPVAADISSGTRGLL
jgi:yeast amino acid transporter